MVVTTGAAMLKGVPVPTNVPPQEPVYQFNVVPEPPFALSVIFGNALGQKLFLSTVAKVGATGNGFIVIVTLAHVDVPHELVHDA